MGNFFDHNADLQKTFHEFGDFRFDSHERTLWLKGSVIDLTPRTADLLNALLERRGHLLERTELIQKVWKDTVVEEGNLSYTVSRLRKVLGRNAEGEHFIQTVPRRGYRFVDPRSSNGEIEMIYERETVVEEIQISESQSDTQTHTSIGSYSLRKIAIALIAVAFVGAVIVGISVWAARSAATGSAGVRSLAVVPFRTVQADVPTHDGLGLADVIITRLRGNKDITVRPTSAVMDLENREIDLTELGKQLQVDAILDGMIYRGGSTLRVTARLTRVSDGATLWTGLFEKPASEESLIENDIVVELANALSLPAAQKAARPYTTNPDAYQLYISGRYEWNKRNSRPLQDAKRLFRSAITVDPNFALAYVGLADSLVFGDFETPELNLVIEKAIELDPELGEAYATLGFMQTVHRWQWKQAEESFRRAIELKPGYATAHHWYAILLSIQGRNEEARAEMSKALEIDPGSYNFLADLGQIYYFERNYPRAEEFCKRALELYPDFSFAHDYLEQIYLKTGKFEAAIEQMVAGRIADELSSGGNKVATLPADYTAEYYRGHYETGGLNGLVEFYVSEDRKNPVVMSNPNTHYRHAQLYALIGDKPRALESLDSAFQGRAFHLTWVKAEPLFDGLRSEPQYQAILKKMDLAD